MGTQLTQTAGLTLAVAASLVIVAAAPAHAGWMEDAIGSFIRETLADSKTIGVSIAVISVIWGLLMWATGWGRLWQPLIGILVGTVIGFADTFIGGSAG